MMKRPPFGSIYKITCTVTSKVYIGLTRDYVSNRWYQHRKAAASGVSSALYQAMRKHGSEHFVIESIASAVSAEALPELERLLVEQYDAYGRGGYNMSMGGESAFDRRMTDAGKARIRAARNRPDALAANRQRNADRMGTEAGRAHQARMVEAARQASDKLSASRRRYASTEAGASQIAAAAALGAKRNAEMSSKAVFAEGRRFVSVRDAAEEFGIERGAVRWRIKSRNFDSWAWA